MPESACAAPPLLGACQTVPPMLPGFIAREPAATRGQPALRRSCPEKATAQTPGRRLWFSLGWLVLVIAGNVPWTFLLGFLPPFRGAAALLVGMGAPACR